jgi:hypothetical protein
MKRVILNTTAIIMGFFIAPAVALICALIVFMASYIDFWRGLFGSMRQPIANEAEPNKPLDIWDKHVARLDKQNQKK